MKTQRSFTEAANGIEQLILALGCQESVEKNSGTFKGKVVDAKTGSRVFGVVVELVGTGRTYVTSPTGYFKMTDVPEGIYLARFTFPGFKEVTEVVPVFSGESLDMTLELEVI
jgi:hypothetical protein